MKLFETLVVKEEFFIVKRGMMIYSIALNRNFIETSLILPKESFNDACFDECIVCQEGIYNKKAFTQKLGFVLISGLSLQLKGFKKGDEYTICFNYI